MRSYLDWGTGGLWSQGMLLGSHKSIAARVVESIEPSVWVATLLEAVSYQVKA